MIDSIDLRGTTDASGDVTVTASRPVYGLLYAVDWEDGDLADGVDGTITVTNTDTGVDVTVLTLTDANDDARHYVRTLEADNTAAALTTYTYPLINGDLKLVIASGGNAKTGGAIVHIIS
jgi:hypothetical protein